MTNEPTTARLIYILRGDDAEARVDAIRQLVVRAHEPEAQGAIYQASCDRDVRVRVVATSALGAIRDDRVFVRLVDLLADARVEVRLAAAETLRDLGDPRATLPLIDALQERNRWVVLAALQGLQRFGTAAARRPLRRLIGSKDVGISMAARAALAAVEARGA